MKHSAKDAAAVPSIKNALFIRNTTSTNTLNGLLANFSALKKPFSAVIKATDTILPFEDQQRLESLLRSKEAPLFMLASSSKKHPASLVVGRCYNSAILDMLELKLTAISLSAGTWTAGARPLMIFQGILWNEDEAFAKLKSIFVDFWSGVENERSLLALEQIQHLVVLTADDHTARASFKLFVLDENKKMVESGLSFEFTLGRQHFAADDIQKQAVEKKKQAPKKVKNVSRDAVLGDKYGKLHAPRQDLSSLQVRKVKALKGGA